MYQSNPVGVELFSYVRTFVRVMLQILCTEIYASEVKLYISSFDLFSKFAEEKDTQHATKLQLPVRKVGHVCTVFKCH